MSARSIPNLLGLFRIVTTPLLVAFILMSTPGSYIAAILLLLLMAVSDIVDGRLARKLQAVSPLGVFLDTISDKIFVAGALIPMVEQHLLSGWIALVIIVRDFAVSGLRSYAAAEGEIIAAREWGKQKLVFTVVALIWRLAAATLTGPTTPPFLNTFNDLSGVSLLLAQLSSWWPIPMGLAVIWTVGSGVDYFWKARYLLSSNWANAVTRKPTSSGKSSAK